MTPEAQSKELHRDIAACTICAEHLPLGPRPVVQFSPRSRIAIIGQAPGTKVHRSGVPWDDDSGDRLREWLGLSKESFYNPDNIALIPMGFCYPGKASGGDAPPRKECAPQWHAPVFDLLTDIRLTLLVGAYSQAHYLPGTRKLSMTDRVRSFAAYSPYFPVPHPAWRVRMWIGKNPWFERDVLPELREAIQAALNR